VLALAASAKNDFPWIPARLCWRKGMLERISIKPNVCNGRPVIRVYPRIAAWPPRGFTPCPSVVKKFSGRILHFGGNFGISIQPVLENHGAVNP
jgi:hypothetical protein